VEEVRRIGTVALVHGWTCALVALGCDGLVDWVAGGTRWRLDGVQMDPPVQYAYGFDRAVVSPSGRYQALYTECGTKGLILDRWGSSDSVVLSYAMGGSQH
jgi:hypothetical protein